MSRPIYWPGLAYFIGMAVAVSGFPVAYVVMAIQFGAWFAWVAAAMTAFLAVAVWGIAVGVVQQEMEEVRGNQVESEQSGAAQ